MNQQKRRWRLSKEEHDADHIEAPILPLVKLLNSQWTFTTACCGGHFKCRQSQRSFLAYPYVLFQVRHGKRRVWDRIFRSVCARLDRHISKKATIRIEQDIDYPPGTVTRYCWRFSPIPREGYSGIFSNKTEFRNAVDSLIHHTCEACQKAMANEQRRNKHVP